MPDQANISQLVTKSLFHGPTRLNRRSVYVVEDSAVSRGTLLDKGVDSQELG